MLSRSFIVVFSLFLALAEPSLTSAVELERFSCSIFRALARSLVSPRGDLTQGVTASQLSLVSTQDPVLRRTAREIDPRTIATPEMQRFFDDMIHTMNRSGGIGLAAPQIGKSVRVAVVMGPKGPLVVINPKIEIVNGTRVSDSEGCLSLPGRTVQVSRPKTVRVHFLDRFGNERLMEMDGLPARVAQHETDHLNGILITDRH